MLEAEGFAVRLGSAVLDRRSFLAGSDEARAADWRAMLLDPEVKAVFAARGGYGSGRLLSLVDPAWARTAPKAVVGHSDLTFLLNDLVQRSGLVAFHGPMVSWFEERPEATAGLLALLRGEDAPEIQCGEVWREGRAEGALVGGCLSIVAALLGTPYQIETRGRILFLEDVNEPPYRVDRMLTQLAHAGVFDEVAAVAFGEMPNCFDGEDACLADLAVAAVGDRRIPLVAGLPSGHGRGLVTLPLGVRVRLDGDRLRRLEPAVEAP